jgi:hypothetical protein
MRFGTLFAGGLLALAAAPAVAQDYDGRWNLTLTCSQSSATNAPPFTDRFEAVVSNNAFTRSRTIRLGQGGDETRNWRVATEGNRMTLTVEASRGNDRWQVRTAGDAASPTRFNLTGGLFTSDGRQTRNCTTVAELAQAAPTALAAPQRQEADRRRQIEALEARAATAERERDAAREAMSSLEQDLRSDIENGRFELNVLRRELDEARAGAQRDAQAAQQRLAAETARATQAEAAAQAAAQRLQAAEAQARQAAEQAQAQLAQARAAAEQAQSQARTQAEQAQAQLAQARQAAEAAGRDLATARSAAEAAQREAAALRGQLEAAQAELVRARQPAETPARN